MNVKRIVLFTLSLYVVGAGSIISIGFLFGDPDPTTDPAQSLLNLNTAAQAGIAEQTNQKIAQTSKTEPAKKTPTKVEAPKATTTLEPTLTPTPTPTPEPTSELTLPDCGAGGTCTLAQVATHNSRSDCWMMLGSKAYNVTSYVSEHPGGKSSFDSSTCGADITAQMQGTAGSASSSKENDHSQGAYNTLNSYFVANVSG